MPAGLLMEAWRNMAKSMAGFSEKPAILFAMFFRLGIATLSNNIATKLSFSVWAADRGLCSAAQRSLSHELRTSSSSHGSDSDGGNNDSNSYSGGGCDNNYGDGDVDGNNGGGGVDSDVGGNKQQTSIN